MTLQNQIWAEFQDLRFKLYQLKARLQIFSFLDAV
jgi:hypothetical protein